LIGFGLTAVPVVYELATDSISATPANFPLIGLLVILCPGSLLAMPFSVALFEAAEAGTPGFYLMWLVIALANSVIYSIVGAAIVGLRKVPEQPKA